MPGLIACIGVVGTPNLLEGGCPPVKGKGVPDMYGLGRRRTRWKQDNGCQLCSSGCCSFVQVDALTVAATTTAAAAAIVAVASQQGSVGAGRGWSFEGYYTVLVSFAPVRNSKTVTATVFETRDRNPSVTRIHFTPTAGWHRVAWKVGRKSGPSRPSALGACPTASKFQLQTDNLRASTCGEAMRAPYPPKFVYSTDPPSSRSGSSGWPNDTAQTGCA